MFAHYYINCVLNLCLWMMFLWAVKVSFPSTSMDPLACFPPPPSGPALQFPLIQSASMGGSCSDKNKDVNAL